MQKLKRAVGVSVAVVLIPSLIVFGGNLGLMMAALAFGEAVPALQLHAETTWQVTRYLGAFVGTCWAIESFFLLVVQSVDTAKVAHKTTFKP